jgi:hypothetical protein
MFAGSFLEFGARTDQFWGIEHDDIELFVVSSHVPHVCESVGMDILDANVVDVSIFLGHHQSFFVEIDSDHIGCFA